MPNLAPPFYVAAFFAVAIFVSGVLLSFPPQKLKQPPDNNNQNPMPEDSVPCPGGVCCNKCAPDIGQLTFISLAVFVVIFVIVLALFNRKHIKDLAAGEQS